MIYGYEFFETKKIFKKIFFFLGILKKLLTECKDGASARTLCETGDKLILEETSKVYKKEKELKKGTY